MLKKKGLRQHISRVAALLMLGVFFLIIVAQTFHRHNPSLPKDYEDDTEFVSSPEKCFICDYVLHKQSQYLHLACPPVIMAPVTKAVTLLSKSYAGIYKFTLQGFTNKGPPLIKG